jgi:hypothetical protein
MINPDLLDEFSAEEQTAMAELRARVHARGSRATSAAPAPKPGPAGPRSAEGKITSSGNSLKHGLASGRVVIPGEDPADFEVLLQDLVAEHAPATATEELLVQQMAQSWWLLQRAIRIQNQAFTETRVDTHKLALFLRYQTTYERAFYRALNSLIKLKNERRKSSPEFVSHKRRANSPQPEFVSQKSAPNTPVSASDEPEGAFAPPPHGRAA